MKAEHSSPVHDVILKGIALLIALLCIPVLGWGLGGGAGVGRAFFGLLGTFVLLATAVGFARYRGWAFVLASAGLLLAWFVTFIRMITSFNAGHGGDGKFWLASLVAVMVLIGYLGRWKMERRFRPHLDVDHEGGGTH